MGKVVRKSEREHKVAAWAGDQERLDRVLRMLREAVPDHEVTATATESDGQTVWGAPEDVFSSMDRSGLGKLEVEAGRYVGGGNWVEVTFDRVKGVRLDTRGESSWVEGVHNGLSNEIGRARPGWWWMRTWLLPVVVGVAAYLAAGQFLLDDRDAGQAWFLALFIVWPVAAAAWEGVRRLLPGFEVLGLGERPRGSRAIAVAGAVVLAFAPFVIELLSS